MRVLLYAYNYYPEPIGIAPLMTELAEGLVKKGHQVRVVTAMPNYPERKIYPGYRGQLYKREVRNGVEIDRCYVTVKPTPGLIGRAMLEGSFIGLSLIKAIAGWRPDIILSTSPSLPACLPVAIAKKVFRCPVVLNLQDILPEAAIQTGLLSNALAIKVFEQLEKFAYASATKISVITPSFAKNLKAKGVADQKMACISNWVDVDFIAPRPKENNAFRREHGLENKFVVLYSGNIARTQGVRTIIHSAQQLKEHPNIQFVVVGEPSQLAELETLSHQLKINNVKLLPFVKREDLPEMLAAADVSLIMQKKQVVGFNMPSKTQVIMASGRPIIASVPLEGTTAEAVKQSNSGLVVKPECPTELAHAIQKLHNSPELVEAMGENGRQFAIKHYSFKQAIAAYENLLANVLREESSRSLLLPTQPIIVLTSDLRKVERQEVRERTLI